MNPGIDVSQWNGDIDWERVKKAKVKFAMIRAGYGASLDQKFKRNVTECNRVGIPCGVYWFSYAYTPEMAAEEAQRCLTAIQPYRVEFPVAFDFEYDSVAYAKKQGVVVDMRLASAIAEAFCGTIEKAKYYAVIYANLDYLDRFYMDEIEKRYGLWLASWSGASKPDKECKIWQYSDKGSVNGCVGYVDMNRCEYAFPALLKAKGLNRLASVKNWYDEVVEWGEREGITDGTRPNDFCTRAEVVAMLKRLYDKMEGDER